MCGIAGEVRFDGIAPARDISLNMANALSHRGPDGSGDWSDRNACLAHKRLAIRDLSDEGNQPSFSRNKEIISVFNGEIYNYDEIKSVLEKKYNIEFKGHCDSEVIPKGFLVWGEEIFSKLEGIFAIALWDSLKKEFYLVRDGIGVKPLYFYQKDKRLLFGSEIKAICSVIGKPKILNEKSLHEFLSHGYIGNNQTMVNDLYQVPTGTILKFTKNNIEEKAFWQPIRNGICNNNLIAQENFSNIFKEACKSQLISDVPISLMLSGGIDSSLLALTINSKSLPLYTAQFKQNQYDETIKAKEIADKIGSEWQTINCDAEENIEHDFRKVIYYLDGHLADPSAFPFYRLCEKIRIKTKVAISGDGGDEFFAGYNTYFASIVASELHKIVPNSISNQISRKLFASNFGSLKKYPFSQMVGRFFEGIQGGRLAHAEWRRYIPKDIEKKLFSDNMSELSLSDPLNNYKNIIQSSSNLLDGILLADQKYYLPSDLLMKVDLMSMAHGLEVRVPFLDRNVMEFANSLSHKLLLGNFKSQKKRFLRNQLNRFSVSKKIINQSKSGFEFPTRNILRDELLQMCDTLFLKNADIFKPYLNSDTIRNIWVQHKNRERDYSYFIWTLLTLAVWWQEF